MLILSAIWFGVVLNGVSSQQPSIRTRIRLEVENACSLAYGHINSPSFVIQLEKDVLRFALKIVTLCVTDYSQCVTLDTRWGFIVLKNSTLQNLQKSNNVKIVRAIEETKNIQELFSAPKPAVKSDEYTFFGVYDSEYQRQIECFGWQCDVLVIEAEFPNGCSDIYICDDRICIHLERSVFHFGIHYVKMNKKYYQVANIDTPVCSMYGKPCDNDVDSDQIKINFNMPRRDFCDFREANPDVTQEPFDETDLACLIFKMAVTEDPDDSCRLETSFVSQTNKNSDIGTIMSSFYKAKYLYEAETGRPYTSSVWFNTNTGNPFEVMKGIFCETSTLEPHHPVRLHDAEKTWKQKLRQLWFSFCLMKDPVATLNNELLQITASVAQSGPERGSSGESTQSTSSANQQTDGGDEDIWADMLEEELPLPPTKMKPCRYLISEICPQNTASDKSFIELTLSCPPNKPRQFTYLSDFFLVFVESGETPMLKMSIKLYNYHLKPSIVQPRRGRQNFYFVIGNGIDGAATLQEPLVNSVFHASQFHIPRANDKAIGVFLLYIASEKGATTRREVQQAVDQISLLKVAGAYIPKPVEGELLYVIRRYIQDGIVYGSVCKTKDCWLFHELIKSPSGMVAPHMFVPVSEPTGDISDELPYESISRCGRSPLPMRMLDFQITDPTPLYDNACKNDKSQTAKFQFGGKPIQTTAQMIVVNLYHFFQKAILDTDMCSGRLYEVTSRASGLGRTRISSILALWRKDELGLKTPSREYTVERQSKFKELDEWKLYLIHSTIQGFYARNEPPLAHGIYTEFMRKVKDEEQQLHSRNQPVTPFECSEKTFKNILRKLNFHYARLHNRDVVLQRPDIVAWRGKYLKIMRDNDASANPLPVVYTDETWIDPHGRTEKAWCLKTNDPKKRKLYNYQKHKISRGGRIIVIHAGTKDGFIHEAMEVYKVHKCKTTDDYHANVGGEVYLNWFKKLLEALRSLGPHLIVIDNASYHTTSDAPKTSDKKSVFYDWIRNNMDQSRLSTLKKEKDYRKWQLVDMAKALKETVPHYRIDKLASDHGHRIVRLPPYNCQFNPIEMVWKDVKHEIRKTNFDQNADTVVQKARSFMLNYTANRWAKHVQHVKRLEREYWEGDGNFDEIYENISPVIIPVRDDDTDTSEDEMDECA